MPLCCSKATCAQKWPGAAVLSEKSWCSRKSSCYAGCTAKSWIPAKALTGIFELPSKTLRRAILSTRSFQPLPCWVHARVAKSKISELATQHPAILAPQDVDGWAPLQEFFNIDVERRQKLVQLLYVAIVYP